MIISADENPGLPSVPLFITLLPVPPIWNPAPLIDALPRALDPALIKVIRNELLQITREKYWEVTERRVNLDYVPDGQREQLQQFFESLEVLPS